MFLYQKKIWQNSMWLADSSDVTAEVDMTTFGWDLVFRSRTFLFFRLISVKWCLWHVCMYFKLSSNKEIRFFDESVITWFYWWLFQDNPSHFSNGNNMQYRPVVLCAVQIKCNAIKMILGFCWVIISTRSQPTPSPQHAASGWGWKTI